MGTSQTSFAQKLPLYTLVVSLLVGLLIGLPLNSQLKSHAEIQIDQTGQILTEQLVKVVRDPIIHQDTLSLQVEVDAMLALEGVHRVSIVDASHRLLAEAKQAANPTLPPSEHRSSITIENTIAGYVSVKLDRAFFSAPVRSLQQIFIAIWLVLTLLLIALAFYLGKKLSARLNRLNQQLPGEDSEQALDELSLLEKRLEPLLATKHFEVSSLQPRHTSLLVINCKNLSELDNILNREHFEALITQLDQLIDEAATLYGATRLSSYSGIHLTFSSDEAQTEHPQQAVYFATALFRLSQQLLSTQGVSVKLAAAITTAEQPATVSQLFTEIELIQRFKQPDDLVSQAAVGEIVLDVSTAEHPSVEAMNITQPDDDTPVHKIQALDDTADQLVSRQAALLAKNY